MLPLKISLFQRKHLLTDVNNVYGNPIKPSELEKVAEFQNMVETFPFYKTFPCNICKNFKFLLFLTTDLISNTQRYYDSLLPVD
jgi:hypothetical protein